MQTMTANPTSYPHIDALPEVVRLERPSFEEFTRHRDTPVILTGCLDEWPLYRSLRDRPAEADKVARVGEAIGRVPISYNTQPTGQFGFDDNLVQSWQTHVSSYEEFSRVLLASRRQRSGGAVYLQGFENYDWDTFTSTMRPIPYMNAKTFTRPGSAERAAMAGRTKGPLVWVGAGGQIVNLHIDPYKNFMCMLNGQKRVTLLPPRATRDLYVAPLDKQWANVIASRVQLTRWDRAEFPRVADALAFGVKATLQPGEMLYVPPLWWHHVESSDLNIMVNCWEDDIPETLLNDSLAGFMEAIVIFAGTSATVREAYRDLYHRYVFGHGVPDSAVTVQAAGDEVEDRATRDRISANLLRGMRSAPAVPAYWREALAEWYDCFVFQAFGDPLPGMPAGELQRMARSLAAAQVR
jgi:hypothetical protein